MHTIESLLPYARHIVKGPCVRRTMTTGYAINPGERVLVAVDSFHDKLVVDTVMRAIREAGASCDLYVVDSGPDREMDDLEEIRTFTGNTPWGKVAGEPPPWVVHVEDFAGKMGYDLLVRGVGGPVGDGPYRYEGIPWVSPELLASGIPLFPYEVLDLLQNKAWDIIWKHGRGGRVRLTDPEGTDLSFTMHAQHFDKPRYGFNPKPLFGHLMGHPLPPFEENEDTEGVVAGCINHWGRPFPHIKVYLERGQVQAVEGGGIYGDAWRQLLDMTKDIQYPGYPTPGLFWLWEIGIGTNPKYKRPRNVLNRSRGAVYERLRSGIIHVGMGTQIRTRFELEAAARGLPYGHLHVHLHFATYELTSASGEKLKVIDHGRLTSLDDPEVVALAAKHGDPKELLTEDWVPAIPGISIPGDYWKEYAHDPATWIKRREEAGLPS